MNAGYYKLSKYIGARCHNDLSFFFKGRLINWSYRCARIVSELYTKDGDGYAIDIDGHRYDVIQTDLRTRVTIRHNGETDRLSAQVDQVIGRDGKKYLLDFKFTKLETDAGIETIVGDLRQQVAYYAWILDDPDVAGGAYIVSNVNTNKVRATGIFDFEPNEPRRALIRRLTELPGYENLKYSNIRRDAK